MTITFPNKTYAIRLERLEAYFRTNLGGIYEGWETKDGTTLVHLADTASPEQVNVVYDYWSGLTESGEATLTASEIKAKLQMRIRKYQDIGRDLVAEFSAENVLLGITIEQVEEVMSTAAKVKLYLEAGSFPTAMSEIDKLPRSAPFFTDERLATFKQKISDIMAAQ